MLLLAGLASPQYFGRNKVLWEEFQFQVLETEHFDIYYYSRAGDSRSSPMAEEAAQMAEWWYDRLSELFDRELAKRRPIILYNSHADFQQTTVTGGLIGQGVGGFTESLQSRLVMPLTGSWASTNHVLGHELVHVFQFDLMRELSRGRGSRAQYLPLWMTEGLAEYLSVGPEDALTTMWLRDAVIEDDLPSLKKLRHPRYFPYRWGHAFWSYIGGRWDDQTVMELYRTAFTIGVETAISEVLELSTEELFEAWHAAIRTASGDLVRTPRVSVGEQLIAGSEAAGRLNVGPALSPDGQRLAFLSSRDLFEIKAFVADATTGEVTGELLSARGSPHFDALRFVDAAGSWSPDGKRFAMPVFAEGDNHVAIVDVDRQKVVRRLRPERLEAILNLAWSPDGRQLAVSGVEDGVSDLYLLDIETAAVTRLTNDRWADLQPAWSPDGTSVVFITDRRSDGRPSAGVPKPLQIAWIPAEGGPVTTLEVFAGHDHLRPQMSPDGDDVFFVSAPDGVYNVYRYAKASGDLARLTDVATGVTGVTAETPSLSVARESGRLVYTVFEDTSYSVYTLAPGDTAGTTVNAAELVEARYDLLPPVERKAASRVAEYLAEPERDLPEPGKGWEVTPYRPALQLLGLGPVGVGTGVDEYGFGVAGGVNAYFGDMLGRHQLGLSASGATYSEDELLMSVQAVYLNRSNRFNWGVGVSRFPYRRAYSFLDLEEIELDGEEVLAEVIGQVRETVTVLRSQVFGHYPLSRNQRLEAGVAYSDYGFDAEVERLYVVNNAIVGRSEEDIPTRPDYSYATGYVAYVSDTSAFAFTSPQDGARMRFEVGRTSGDFGFTTALADYRRYVSFRPGSFAVRLVHYGRYGDDAETELLRPLYVGDETLIHGYSAGSFDVSECTATDPEDPRGCPEIERLQGSRLAVLNLELRLQVLGTSAYGLAEMPYAPTELAAFVDVGAAWTSEESVEMELDTETIERVPVVSAGLLARVLLGGLVPMELYAAHPFHRPEEDWTFGFLIKPGW
jgi:hypothetical protein